MKKTVRIICAVFAALIVLCHLCVFAGVENGEAAVVFDTVGGLPGECVEMNVHLTKNPGITGLRFIVEYDERKMSLESAEYTKLGGGGLTSVKTDVIPFVLMWNVATKEFTETGVLATLRFKIKATADAGSIPVKVSYGKGDCIDFNLKNLDMNITEGAVKVLYDGSNCRHTDTERVTTAEPSCNTLGHFEKRCKTCGTVTGEGNIPYTEHSWGEFIVKKEPSYFADGYMEKECSSCKETARQAIPKYEHTGEETVYPPSSDTSASTDGEDTQSTPSTENPATGDETWILGIAAAVSGVLLALLIIKRAEDKRKADPTVDHKKE